MKTLTLMGLVVLVAALFGCGGRNERVSDLELQATVQAALYATSTAQANDVNAVNAAVNATLTAVVPTPTVQTMVVTATPQPASAIAMTPLPPAATRVAVVQLTEAELEALIDQAVTEAVAASQAAATTTTNAMQDNTVTTAETQTMAYTVAVSQQQLDEALALIDRYYALYGEVSQETLAQLQAMEQDLNEIAQSTSAMAQSLEEINQTLAQGLALAQDTIDELETAAASAQAKANEAKGQAQDWYTATQAQIETRAQTALNVAPNVVAGTPQQAADQLRGYVETTREALSKGTLSQQDINAIAQQGANAKAGLQKFGRWNAEQMTGAIDQMTRRVAKGELPQAKQEMGTLERSAQAFEFGGAANSNGGVRPGGNNARPTLKARP